MKPWILLTEEEKSATARFIAIQNAIATGTAKPEEIEEGRNVAVFLVDSKTMPKGIIDSYEGLLKQAKMVSTLEGINATLGRIVTRLDEAVKAKGAA